MIFLLVSVVVPILIYTLLPVALSRVTKTVVKPDVLLLLACILYFFSWYLPSPLIHGQNTSFTTHFVGGGLFTALIWMYCLRALKWKRPKRYGVIIEAALLFAAVSALGVLNELFELFIVEIGLSNITLRDTSYDLFANTLGAALFFIVYAFTGRRYT